MIYIRVILFTSLCIIVLLYLSIRIFFWVKYRICLSIIIICRFICIGLFGWVKYRICLCILYWLNICTSVNDGFSISLSIVWLSELSLSIVWLSELSLSIVWWSELSLSIVWWSELSSSIVFIFSITHSPFLGGGCLNTSNGLSDVLFPKMILINYHFLEFF